MKKIYTLLVLCVFTLSLSAQLPDGVILENFTGTDLDGNEFNLYELLDEGKSVVLDVSATWCPPCWSYHNGGVLENVWETYGPDGTDEIFVLFIEGDNNTSLADLNGTGNNTLGDWVTGTHYPIIDDGSLSQHLNIAFFPTLYMVCPNRQITQVGQLSSAASYKSFNDNCLVESGENNMAILTGLNGTGCAGETFEPSYQVQNIGSAEVTSFEAELSKNGTVLETATFPNTLETYDALAIDFSSIILEAGPNNFTVEITSVNTNADTDASNNSINEDIFAGVTGSNELTLTINTDNWGYETYWEVRTDMGTVANGGNLSVGANGGGGQSAAAGNPGAYGSNTTVTETIVLPEGANCYEFLMVDDWGDGMPQGSYQITDQFGAVVEGGGDFGDSQTRPFTVDASLSAENAAEVATSLNVFPNPVNNQMTVEFGLEETENIEITVYNAIGQRVSSLGLASYTAGTQVVNIDATSFESGMYLVTLRGSDFATSRKFTVSK